MNFEPETLNPKPKTFYSNGKLLLTGEYVVLDGALSLAVPTKLGQSLKVELIDENRIIWKSLDEKGAIWFEEIFEFSEVTFPLVYQFSTEYNKKTRLDEEGKILLKLLFSANQINKSFLMNFIDTEKGIKITTELDFPKNWGLGTSSTLVNNIANWAKVDAFQLLAKTFGGSGYDIACAQHDVPITYQLNSNQPKVKKVAFNPVFKDNLYFVYLNKKQNSRDAIAHYRSNRNYISGEISEINTITNELIDCDNLADFQRLMEQHERIISCIIKQKTIKELLFSDFNGSIKSLGAWGGDFVMVASQENPSDYFKTKGFETIIPYQDLIK